jgi:hypothetical protein
MVSMMTLPLKFTPLDLTWPRSGLVTVARRFNAGVDVQNFHCVASRRLSSDRDFGENQPSLRDW